MPTLPGAIAHHFRHNHAQAEQLSITIMDAAIAGDAVAGLACILSVLMAEESEGDDEAQTEEEDAG